MFQFKNRDKPKIINASVMPCGIRTLTMPVSIQITQKHKNKKFTENILIIKANFI